ncbi:MAG: hypothetical protein II768_06615 [Clostridia bacterium]|nr:hypothetical protein [Clostridia bacterium]
MKKRIAWLLAAALLLIPVLCACDGADAVTTDYIYFKNDTGYKVPGFYLSTAEEEEWGEKLNWGEYVGVGGRIHIDVEKLVNGAGQYDVGAIDERGLNYEVYDVDLAPGDVISLRAEDDIAVCIVTHIAGGEDTYYGYAYYEEDDLDW